MTSAVGVLTRPVAPPRLGVTLKIVVAAALAAASVAQIAHRLETTPPAGSPPVAAATATGLAGLPMAWVANTGGTDPQVRYSARGLGYGAFLTDTEAVVRVDGAVVRLGFDGADSEPSLTAAEPLDATMSSFVGTDPSTWQSATPTSAVVRYEDLWPGIDLAFRGSGSALEWDLHVDAKADPAAAGVEVVGADRIELDGDHATLTIGDSQLAMDIPSVWQVAPDGARIPRETVWERHGDVLRVVPHDWDPNLPGVIDPTLDWSTFLGGGVGGTGADSATGIGVDSAGNTYLTGSTTSADFPTTAGALDDVFEGAHDSFVSKLDPTGSTLLYSTLLGGTFDAYYYEQSDLAVDEDGNAYVTGTTIDGAVGFPTTPGAFDTTPNGGTDAYAIKLDPDGGLAYGTLLGGSGTDVGTDVAIDTTGNAYLTGSASSGFPTTVGAYDTSPNGGLDAYVAKLDPAGSTLVYSTLIGGDTTEGGNGIAVDSTGYAYVAGDAANGTVDFPTTVGAFDTTHSTQGDAFVTKLDPTGSTLVYSTYLGGTGGDHAAGIAIDTAGNAYVGGYSSKPSGSPAPEEYPTTAGAYDTTRGGESDDLFVTKIGPSGSSLVYSTLLGGNAPEYNMGGGIAVDGAGRAVVTGYAFSGYPTTTGAFDTTVGGTTDAVVTRLNAAGSALDYSTYLGGGGHDRGESVALDSAGDIHVTGRTEDGTTDFPTTAGAYDVTHNGGTSLAAYDAFATKLSSTGTSLAFSTLLGGSDGTRPDEIRAVAVDDSGIYVTGTTSSGELPTTAGAYDTTQSDVDAFVTKLDLTGTALLYSTFLGGSGGDTATAIAVDDDGSAYVTGTRGAGFPVTPGAYSSVNGDVFVAKIDPSGGALDYSLRIGGGDTTDVSNGITVNESGDAYVVGTTSVPFALWGEGFDPFPTTPGAYDTIQEVYPDAFVTRIAATGDSLVYSTLLSGTFTSDSGNSVAVDTSGNAYITGSTYLDDTTTPIQFPTTPGAFDTSQDLNEQDAFVTKLNPTGTALVYSTLLGHNSFDTGSGIAVDAGGSAYVTGTTGEYLVSDFPTTTGAFDPTPNGDTDAFVTKLDPAGAALAYSTFLGGNGTDTGRAIAIDAAGYAYLTGSSGSSFPTSIHGVDTSPNGGLDAFATRLNPGGTALAYSTLLGGSAEDLGRGIAVTDDGLMVVAGTTASTAFPVTPGAYDDTNVGVTSGFVSVIDPIVPATGGCKGTTTPGAEIGMYPAQPGSQSSLRVSCRFDSGAGVSSVPSALTVHDFDVARYHNGAARTVTNTAAISSGTATFTLASFAGTSGWVNRPITAIGVAGLAPRTFVKSISAAGLVTLSAPTTAAIAAGTTFTIENARARSVVDGVTTASSTTLTSSKANFTAADMGLSLSGTTIGGSTTIASVTNATTAELSAPATATGSGQTIALGATLTSTSTRQVNDAANTSSTVITSTAAKFKSDDVGLRVTGAGIPAGTYITAIAGATATTTGGLTPNSAPQTIVIGEPSVTAPTSAETAATLAIQLDLAPALVAGSDPCANDNVEALTLVARWNNPGAFQGTGLANTQPAGTKAIGQLFFDNAITDFSAYVIERPALTSGEPLVTAHYDVVFPLTLTSTAMCASPTSPGVGFSLGVQGQTLAQAALPDGVGRPESAVLRSIVETATGGYSSTAFVTSDDPAITLMPASEFTRLCVYPSGPAAVGFKCGNG